MRLVIFAPGKMAIIRGDKRQARRISKLDQWPLDPSLHRKAMALDFHIEPPIEKCRKARQPRTSLFKSPLFQRLVNRPTSPACEGDQSGRMGFKHRPAD